MPRGQTCNRRSGRVAFPTDRPSGRQAAAGAGGRRIGRERLILCQITSQPRSDRHSVLIRRDDFDQGQLAVDSYARVNRLFTVDQATILYSAARLKPAKLDEVKEKIRALFA